MSLKKSTLKSLAVAALATFGVAAQAETVYGWTAATSASTAAPINLIKYDLSTPTVITTVGAFTGVVSGHTVRSMDFNPANGQLFAISTALTPQQYQLYSVNKTTAALTAIGSPQAFTSTNSIGELEINPVTGVGHFVTRTGTSMRINLADGSTVASDPPATGLLGAIDCLGGAFTSTGTLFVWDYNDDTIYTLDTATGVATAVYTPPAFLTFNAGGGMDISPSSGAMYAVHDEPVGGTRSDLFSVSTSTGMQTLISNFGSTTYVTEIAIEPSAAPATISGTVNLGSYVGTATGSATVSLNYAILDMADVVLSSGTVSVTPSGGVASYSVPAGGASGSVKVQLSGGTWLKRKATTTVGATNADLILPNGNASVGAGTQIVDIADYTVLAGAFSATEGSGSYAASADLNKDAIIDIADYTILSNNFSQTDD